MNAAEAESLLPIYRAGRRAEGRLQKAVRLAEGNETLRQKLSDQMEFDDQIVDVIHFIRPPEDLREKLREVSARARPGGKLRRQILNPAVLTAIVGVLLILGFIGWSIKEKLERFPGRESVERMLNLTSKMTGQEFDLVSSPSGTLGDWFYMRGFEGYSVPPEIATLPAVGSRVFELEGHRVAQLAVDRNDSILYVFNAAEFGVQIPPEDNWRVFEHQGWAAALRRHHGLCHVLAIRGTKAQLQTLLETLKKP